MSLKNQALSGVKWTFIQQVGVQGIGFVISIILARLLTPKEFGLIGMIYIFIGIGNTLLNAGMGSSLIRSKEEELDEADYSTVFYFNLVVSLVIYGAIFLLAPYIALFYKQPLLTSLVRWLSLILIINAFALIQQTRLTKLMDFKTQAKVAIPALIIGGIIGVSMAYMGYGVWSLIAFNVAKAFFSALFFWLQSKWHPLWVFHPEKFKKHFHFGYKLTLSGLLDTIYSNAYNIVIGKFFLPAQVGFYQRAKALTMYPVGTISAIMGKVTYPLFSKIQDDNIRLKSVYKKILQMNIFVLAPVLMTAGVLATPLFRFLLTDKWLPAVPYFQILLITGLLYPIHAFNLNILNVKGRSDLFLKLEIVKKLLVTFAIIIALNFGIYGLLWSSVATSILAFFINTHYSGRLINYSAWEQIKDIIPLILLSVIVGISVYFFDRLIVNYSDFVRLFAGSLLSIMLYLCLSYFTKMDSLSEILIIVKSYQKK